MKNMAGMFRQASSFNGDLSEWDVSSVTNMVDMFLRASSFKQKLCWAAWVQSKANQIDMFAGSPGSISKKICTPPIIDRELVVETDLNALKSGVQLKIAVDVCLKVSPKGDCSTAPRGLIGEWDVSRVSDMGYMFFRATQFQGDISHWDVSGALIMRGMFMEASSFHGDLSKWDVSNVRDMADMFKQASSFNRDVSKWKVERV